MERKGLKNHRVPGVHTTTDMSVAIRGGYIGEVTLIPTRLAHCIRVALRGPQIPYGTIFYYGTVDKEMAEKFGYDLT